MNTVSTQNIRLILFIPFFMFSCGSVEDSDQTYAEHRPEESSQPSTVSEDVSYEVESGQFTDSALLKGYMVYPSPKGESDGIVKDIYPGILVVHEWWGHNDYARSRADELAELGYIALAVDMYGEGKQAEHPKDAQEFAGMVLGNLDLLKARFLAGLTTLKNNPYVDSTKIGAIGYCMGGSIVLTMASTGVDLKAVAAFHAGLQLPVMPSEDNDIQARILVANGADDPFISAEQTQAFKAALDAAGANYEYIAYEGAVHAFTNPEADTLGNKFDLPLAYNQEADKKSWEAMKALFDETF